MNHDYLLNYLINRSNYAIKSASVSIEELPTKGMVNISIVAFDCFSLSRSTPASVCNVTPVSVSISSVNNAPSVSKTKLLLNETIIVIETEKNTIIESFPSIKIIDERYYGKTKITFLCLVD